MKLWILSDLHDDRGLQDIEPPADFDVFVCAGDMLSGDVEGSIEMVAHLAGGRLAVFVAGNHEWISPTMRSMIETAYVAAARCGVVFLECDKCEIGGVRFAGATLWAPGDPRYAPSARALIDAGAAVIVTHFEPAPDLLMRALPIGGLWIYGHHHGHSVRRIGARVLIRNALGYGNEPLDDPPAIPDYVFET